jgi:hypothetical protein
MSRKLPRSPLLFCTLLAMLLAGWLYWPTVRLPLIYDTLLHIRIAGGLTLGSVWLPTEAFGFYRPMTFFPMLLIHRLFDGYPAWLLHGNNVVQHAVNAGLLAWLSWRLWADWRRALAAGAIFAVYPFAYQAVAVYGHNVHPAITGLMLLGLHTYLTAVSHPSPRKWWLITAGLFVLMVLTHETAVLFGGLALLVQLCTQPELLKQWQKLLRQPWRTFLLAGLVYLVIYQFLPISRAPQVEATGASLWLNGLYLLQAAVFPLAWFAHLLPGSSGASLTLVSGGLVLAASGWLAWQRPSWRAPLLLAWGWWGAASLLIGVTLPTEYLLRGPRLLYLGSVGVALLWAHLLAGVWPLTPASSLKGEGADSRPLLEGGPGRGFLWTTVLLFILITSGQFVRTKLTQYEQLTEPVRVWQTNPYAFPDAEVVFVNLPQWLDVPPNTYAIGVEFVAMLGNYLFVEELTNANGIGKGTVWAVEVPELHNQTAYAYGIHAQHSWPPLTDKTRLVFTTQFAANEPQTRLTGVLFQSPATDDSVVAQFDVYQLLGSNPNAFAFREAAKACDGLVNIWLSWRPRSAAIPDTTSVFVQVLDANGRLLAQADGPPLGVRPGLLAATPDWVLFDLREIELAEGETAHTVLVGVYDFASGTRSPATDRSGQALPDNAWRLSVSPCPTE